MNRRTWSLLAAACVAGGAGAIAFASSRSSSSPPAEAVAKGVDRMPFREAVWPAGERATYALAWHSEASAAMEGAEGALVTRLAVAGDLELRSYGPRDGAVLLGVRLPRLDEARGEAMGAPVAAPGELASQLSAAEASVLLEPDGHVREIGFSEASSPLAQSALRALVLELAAVVCAAAGERESVDTPLGRARVVRDGGESERVAYDTLDVFGGAADELPELSSRGSVVFDERRLVERVASDESLVATTASAPLAGFRSTTSLTATLRKRERGPDVAPPEFAPGWVRAAPGIGSVDRRASLERRAEGVTRASLLADVRKTASLSQPSSHEWIWRDGAFLELHPEEAAPLLASAMADPSLAVQAVAFDIVVISGTEVGQAALVQTLASMDPGTERFEVLLERLGQLARPTAPTLAFAEGVYAKARTPSARRTAAFMLGALARHAEEHDAAATERIVHRFEAELREAKTNDARVTLLGGLGNAGQSRGVPTIVPYAEDEDEDVRHGVASALRRMEGEPVVRTLLALARDPSPRVATEAMTSLSRKDLDDPAWAALSAMLREGALAEDVHATLLALAAERREDDPRAVGVLVAMLASASVSAELKMRVEGILRGSDALP